MEGFPLQEKVLFVAGTGASAEIGEEAAPINRCMSKKVAI